MLVTGNPYRHPAVLANMAATLDVISGGRLELGLGAGWNQEESDAYGIELPPLKERFDRFDEALEVITSLLTEHRVPTFDGQHYQLHRRALRAQAGAAAAPADLHRRQRARTARCARWLAGPSTGTTRADPRSSSRPSIDVLHERCAEIGRDPSEILISTHLRLDADDPAAIEAQVTAAAEAGIDLGIVYLPTPHTPDVLEPLAAGARSRSPAEVPVERVADLDDPRLADYRHLREPSRRMAVERDRGIFTLEGALSVEALLASPYVIRSVLVAEEHADKMVARLGADVDALRHAVRRP